MPQSLSKIILHTVFSTKLRQPFLRDEHVRNELYRYLATVLKNFDCPAIVIGGVEDHIHILSLLSRTRSVAELVEEAKTTTSRWMKKHCPEFYWQAGYGSFSVSESNIDDVRRYIENQAEHHARYSYQDEFRKLCQLYGVDIDERYVWD